MGIGINDPYVSTVKSDYNHGIKVFKSPAQQYITRKEVAADLKAGQQYYTFGPDVIRVRNVRINNGSLIFPIPTVESENDWNALNVIPQFAMFYPKFWFIRGSNEVGIWPIPSNDIEGAFMVSYDARLQDMYVDDHIGSNVTVTYGSNVVTCSDNSFTPAMANQNMKLAFTDGSDGNWYNIVGYTNNSQILLDNNYPNVTQTNSNTLIGSTPDFPEEYHKAPIYYAEEQYFLFKRISQTTADSYHARFNDLQTQYLGTFSDKETSQIIIPGQDMLAYNPLFVNPISMDGP
jgi:hypothetical protein